MLCSTIKAVVQGPPQQLIETVAEKSAAAVLSTNAGVSAIDICVKKPNAPIDGMFDHVGARPCSAAVSRLAFPLTEIYWLTWIPFTAHIYLNFNWSWFGDELFTSRQ